LRKWIRRFSCLAIFRRRCVDLLLGGSDWRSAGTLLLSPCACGPNAFAAILCRLMCNRGPGKFCFSGSKTNFNTLGTTSTALSTFGKVLTVHDARVVQLGLKFNF